MVFDFPEASKMTPTSLPFKVGQSVEVKSFELGYRGAWFQCKILKIYMEKRDLIFDLEYLDFPDEAMHQTKVFQKREGGKVTSLMVRPAYPPSYNDSEVQNIKGAHEPLLVVHGVWKVGDLVDWWVDNCYWSGRVTQVKESNTFEVELFPPPYGEGEKYVVMSKDLRPSLEWSLKDGWAVPCSKDGEKRQCAKLVTLNNKDQAIGDVRKTGEEETERVTKKLKSEGDVLLNIMESDAIEAAIFDLEELIVRIEWLKNMVGSDIGSANSSWEYMDCRPSST